MNTAKIIAIGNELLIGDTVNTNGAWISQRLTEHGFQVIGSDVIRDDADVIKQEIRESMKQVKLTLVTGGLGPTHDDVTKHAVADLFEVALVTDEQVLRHVTAIFERRGFRLSALNRSQAAVPAGASVLFNKMGTAPGIWLEREGRFLVLMPGVPYEMKWIFEHSLEEKLKEKFGEHFADSIWRQTRYYKTAGVPESLLAEQSVGDLGEYLNEGTEIAYLPAPGEVTLRGTVFGKSREEMDQRMNRLDAFLEDRIGDVMYARSRDVTLEEVIRDLLRERGWTIATAESCTGGLLADTLTNVPGCSSVMMGGVVAYANDVKRKVLGVSEEDLRVSGAVSLPVALQMASGAARLMNADVGVSTTGVAGPGGGSPEKPVGTVWIGFCIRGRRFAVNPVYSKDRRLNKILTVRTALETLRREILHPGSALPYQLKRQDC